MSDREMGEGWINDLARWVRRGLMSPILAALINILGLALTLALLALGSPIAAGIVVGCLILVGGALYLYARIVRDRVGGLFAVVHDVHEWRILDHSGETATMKRTRKARVLQDGVFAIREFAWGSDDSHVTPKCDRWPVVYEYIDHDRKVALVALEDVKSRDDPLDYSIEWEVNGVFVDPKNWVETEVLHETARLTMRVVLPATRAPMKVSLTRLDSSDKRKELGFRSSDDGQTFEIEHDIWYPKRHHTYRIAWEWPENPPHDQHAEELAAAAP